MVQAVEKLSGPVITILDGFQEDLREEDVMGCVTAAESIGAVLVLIPGSLGSRAVAAKRAVAGAV